MSNPRSKAKRTVDHQDKVLAAAYSIHQKNLSTGKGTRIDFAYNLVRERHPEIPVAQLNDVILKRAKNALVDHGALIPINGPVNNLSEDAVSGIRSWKQKAEVDPQDDEFAADRYLERGVKAGFVVASSKSRKTVSTSRSPPTSKLRSAKGKEKVTSEDEQHPVAGEESVGKGKKRESKVEGGRAPKKVKIVARDDSNVDKDKKGKGDGKTIVVEKVAKGVKSKDQNSEAPTKAAPKRKTGPAGPGIHSLKKTELIQKIRELEDVLEENKIAMNVDSQEEDDADDVSGEEDDVSAGDKTGKSDRAEDGTAGLDNDDDDLSELEDEEDPEPAEQARESTDHFLPLPLGQASLCDSAPSTSRNRAHTTDQPSAHEVSSLRQELEVARSNEKANLERNQGLREELERVSHAYQDLVGDELPPKSAARHEGNAIENVGGQEYQAESDVNDASSIADKTHVEEGHFEHEGKMSPRALFDLGSRDDLQDHRELSKYPAERIGLDSIPDSAQDASVKRRSSTPGPTTLEELAAAKEEIAKLTSIRNELARERNDATEEKANLRRKVEELKDSMEEIDARSRGLRESGQAQVEKLKAEIEELNKKLQADQQTIAALTQDLSDLETGRESLERKVEQQQADLDAFSANRAQLQQNLGEVETQLEESINAATEKIVDRVMLQIRQLEDDLRTAQEDLRQAEEEKQNEVDEISKECRAKDEELRTARTSYTNLHLDVINLAVSCSLRVDDTASAKSIINDLKTRHLSVVQQLAHQQASYATGTELARSLLQIVSPRVDLPADSTLEDLLKALAVRVSDVVRQAHQAAKISNEAELVNAIADLVVAGGGTEVPTSFTQIPKALEGVQNALVEKNTTILQLEARLQAAQMDLGEANL
ncbi:hypothetical protein JCM11491_007065 [Sporobolomyces phaffii]